MKMQFEIVFKNGPKTVTIVRGREEGIETANLTVADVTEQVLATEQFIEKLTGLRVHINQVG